MWGSFLIKKDHCKNLTKWILLTHHVQGLTCILQDLWKLSKVGIYFKISHDAFKSYSCHWDLWLLRYRFHGSISSIIWFLVYVAVDYVSKWIEAIPSRNNDHKTVIKFLKKNILSRFGIPRAMISDDGTHFCNKSFESLIKKYGITYKVATPYHPQTSGQVELANREIKQILEKIVNPNSKDWSLD